MNFSLMFSQNSDSARIQCNGELDIFSKIEFENKAFSAIDKCNTLEIDLSDVEYMDSSGLAGIIGVAKKYAQNNKSIIISGARDSIKSQFRLIDMKTALQKINADNIIKE